MDNFYYYSRTEEGKQYRIHCRKKGNLEAAEEVILDENELAKGKEYFRLGVFEISTDHRLLAFSADTDGSETYTIRVKHLETGELLADEIPNTYYSVEWANDNRTLFYNVLDDAKRPYKLFRHILGTDPAKDAIVFHEADDAFFLGLSKTRSKKYLLTSLKSNTTTEVHYLDADQPGGTFALMVPRTQDMEYYAAHHGEHFLIRTNQEAKNFRIMTAPVSNPTLGNWREMIPHREDVLLESLSAFEDHLVVYERENGLQGIRISDANNSNVHYVKFDEPVYSLGGSSNPRVQDSAVAIRLQLAHNPAVSVRLRCGRPHPRVEETIRGSWRLRAFRLRVGKSFRGSVRWREGADFAGVQEGSGERRQEPALPLRVRLLRL